MQLSEIVETSRWVSETSSRLAKVGLVASCLRRLEPDEIRSGVACLSGELLEGRIGVGFSTLHEALPDRAAAWPTLTLQEVESSLHRLASVSGPGSSRERLGRLRDLFARATRSEQDFLRRLILGELRQGALEGLLVEAVAQAAGVASREVRRALLVCGDIGTVARLALSEGASALSRFSIQLFRPLVPMLAQSAADLQEALSRLATAAFEYKVDGARVQIHKSGQDARLHAPAQRRDGSRA